MLLSWSLQLLGLKSAREQTFRKQGRESWGAKPRVQFHCGGQEPHNPRVEDDVPTGPFLRGAGPSLQGSPCPLSPVQCGEGWCFSSESRQQPHTGRGWQEAVQIGAADSVAPPVPSSPPPLPGSGHGSGERKQLLPCTSGQSALGTGHGGIPEMAPPDAQGRGNSFRRALCYLGVRDKAGRSGCCWAAAGLSPGWDPAPILSAEEARPHVPARQLGQRPASRGAWPSKPALPLGPCPPH